MPIFSKKLKVGVSIDGAMPPQYRYMSVIRVPSSGAHGSSLYRYISSAFDPSDLSVDNVTHESLLNNSIGIEIPTTDGESHTITLYVEATDGTYADTFTGTVSCSVTYNVLGADFGMFTHRYGTNPNVGAVTVSPRRIPIDRYPENLEYVGDYDTQTFRLLFCQTPDGKIFLAKYASAMPVSGGQTDWGMFAYNQLFGTVNASLQGIPIEVEYPNAEDDEDDGGGGDFDPSSDPVDFPDGIDVSSIIANCELLNAYAVSQASLILLNDYLWSSNFFDNVQKAFNSPMQAVAGLHILPFTVTGSAESITIGGLDTEISSQKITNFVKNIDIGSLTINEYWGNFLDYENTTVKLYLPFVGFQVLETKKVVGATLSIRYRVDILTGDFQVFVKRSKGDYMHVLYTFSGNMAMSLPLSQSTNAITMNSLLGLTNSLGFSAISGGGGVALGMSALKTVGGAMAQNAFGESRTIQHNGSYGGNKGYMGEMTPYIVIERAKQQIPTNYNKFVGIPSYFRTTLSECHGFTQVQSIHLVCGATAEEKNKLENLLKSGVIL